MRTLTRTVLEKDVKHTATTATYSIVFAADGRTYLQIDTYGSATRQRRGAKSQSIRFASGALRQLRAIIETHF